MSINTSGRAAFQVLVLPYLETEDGTFRYALLRRMDAKYWQGVAGGGEQGETPLDAARREARDEAGISTEAEVVALDSTTTIPVVHVTGDFRWGPDVLVIPEHTFGVRCTAPELTLSGEHTECKWCSFEEATASLQWDSNRSALWELDHRLRRGATLVSS